MPGPLARATATMAPDGTALQRVPGIFYAVALVGALALDATYPQILKLDPGGADRNVTLDEDGDGGVVGLEGMRRTIANGADAAGEVLTILDADGSTVLTYLHIGEAAEFYCGSSGWSLVSKWRHQAPFEALTLTGTLSLSGAYPTILKLDPGGAHRDVLLDTDGDSGVVGLEGTYRRIVNGADAAENLVVKGEDGSTTVGTVNQNEQGEFYCTSAGWVLIAITTIALA